MKAPPVRVMLSFLAGGVMFPFPTILATALYTVFQTAGGIGRSRNSTPIYNNMGERGLKVAAALLAAGVGTRLHAKIISAEPPPPAQPVQVDMHK